MTHSGTIIGKQISRARVERNLTRQDLAVILGISPIQVERFETGAEDLPAGLLYRLTEVFDLPVTAFFKQPDESRTSDSPAGGLAYRS